MKDFVQWFRQTVLPLLGFGPLWKVDPHAADLATAMAEFKKKQQAEPRTRRDLEMDVINARRGLMHQPTSLAAAARMRRRFTDAVREREDRRDEES